MEIERNKISLTALIAATVIVSGCISTSSASLSDDFDTEASPVDLNRSGDSILEEAFSERPENYSVDAETEVLFYTPITSVRLTLSSNGSFDAEFSNVETYTKMDIGGLNESESEEQPVKTVITDGDTSRVEILAGGNETEEVLEAYTREELGISMEALEQINVEDAELLGTTGEDDSQLLLEPDVDSSDLVDNYEDIMEVNAISSEESSTRNSESISKFNQSEAYAWVNKDTLNLERYSYFGSAAEGNVQVRLDARFDS